MLIKSLMYPKAYFTDELYNSVHNFFIELNKNNDSHISWNWARFEWMYGHPDFDIENSNKIALWIDHNKVVGIATYDMYFGEGFVANLSGYEFIFSKAAEYAYKELKDDNGLGVSINDENAQEIALITNLGFKKVEQSETVLVKELDSELSIDLPDGFSFCEVDYYSMDRKELEWFFYQGFDHGNNRDEFNKLTFKECNHRPHFDKRLSIGVKDKNGMLVAHCCVWYLPETDYAYVEPVCVLPNYRKKGLGKIVVYKALRVAKEMGAKKAYVISDKEFYKKLGFSKKYHYSFYWKK